MHKGIKFTQKKKKTQMIIFSLLTLLRLWLWPAGFERICSIVELRRPEITLSDSPSGFEFYVVWNNRTAAHFRRIKPRIIQCLSGWEIISNALYTGGPPSFLIYTPSNFLFFPYFIHKDVVIPQKDENSGVLMLLFADLINFFFRKFEKLRK